MMCEREREKGKKCFMNTENLLSQFEMENDFIFRTVHYYKISTCN